MHKSKPRASCPTAPTDRFWGEARTVGWGLERTLEGLRQSFLTSRVTCLRHETRKCTCYQFRATLAHMDSVPPKAKDMHMHMTNSIA